MFEASFRIDNEKSWTTIIIKCHFKYADYEILHTLFIDERFVTETSRKTESISNRFKHYSSRCHLNIKH